MCCTCVRLAVQQVVTRCHTNMGVMHCMAVTSLGDRDSSAPLRSYGTTIIKSSIIDQLSSCSTWLQENLRHYSNIPCHFSSIGGRVVKVKICGKSKINGQSLSCWCMLVLLLRKDRIDNIFKQADLVLFFRINILSANQRAGAKMQCNDWSSKYLNIYSQWCLLSCEISLIKIIFFCKYAQDLRVLL